MTAPSSPIEIARETFRLLAARRIPPTPENYRALFHEVAGTPEANDVFPEKILRNLQQALPKITPEQMRLSRELENAIQEEDWDTYKTRLTDFVGNLVGIQLLPWNELIGELVKQWESRQTSATLARKRETLEHVLKTGGNPDALFIRLQNTIRHWGLAPEGAHWDEETLAPSARSDLTGNEDSQTLFAYSLENILSPLLVHHPLLLEDARSLSGEIRNAKIPADWKKLRHRLRHFAFQIELLSEDDRELQAGLLGLLRLVVDNIDQLVLDDKWMHGQIEMLRSIIDSPLSQRAIEDAERRMKDVIFHQSQLKHRMLEAQGALKSMLTGFIDHLANLSDATSDYHNKIEGFANKISQSSDIVDLKEIVAAVMHETRLIQLSTQHSRDELRSTQARVSEAENRIRELEQELAATSTLVRYDQLTGVMNRRGLEETFDKELRRATRHQTPICVALLDIDNFKKLNDALGHDAGDAALVHLATVIRETLRPEDSVARFGGEEFILIMPETTLDDAQHVLVRLQRELTRRIFLHDHHKTLITFSAGVAQLQADDTQASLVKRADTAMYQAKQTGKNRVCLG